MSNRVRHISVIKGRLSAAGGADGHIDKCSGRSGVMLSRDVAQFKPSCRSVLGLKLLGEDSFAATFGPGGGPLCG
jgi:hypothetical protein